MNRREFIGMVSLAPIMKLNGIFEHSMKKNIKNVGILMFPGVEVLDFAGPFEVFSVTAQLHDNNFFNVFTLAKRKEPVVAINGLSVNVDFDFDEHPPIDVLIVPGGAGTRVAMLDAEILEWVRRQHESAGLTLSVCSGARLLGTLRLLDNREFCTHHEVYDHMKEISPLGIPRPDKRFTQSSEKIFTSGGITAGIDLSFHVVANLCGESVAHQTARYMEYITTTD